MKQTLKQILKFLRLNWELLLSLLFGCFVIFFLAGILFSQTYLQKKELVSSPTSQPEVVLKKMTELPKQVDLVQEDDQYVPDLLPVKYVVQKGDSSWQLAEAFYGCGQNYRDIEQANSLTPDQRLEVGQELLIPRATVRCEVVKTEVIDNPEPIETVTDGQPASPGTYVVQPGDCLWTIAFEQFGNPYRWTEIYELNRAVIGANPDLIFPQTQLILPAQ